MVLQVCHQRLIFADFPSLWDTEGEQEKNCLVLFFVLHYFLICIKNISNIKMLTQKNSKIKNSSKCAYNNQVSTLTCPFPSSLKKEKTKTLLQPLEWNTLEEKRDESEPYFSLNAKIPMIHSEVQQQATWFNLFIISKLLMREMLIKFSFLYI